MIRVAKTPTEAQDIRKGGTYTDGVIVFTVDKVRPWDIKGTVVTTKTGIRIIMANTDKVTKIKV